jgi:hypothetical protein
MGIGKRGSLTDLHLRTALEQSPLGTAILGPDGRYLLVNAAWNALWALGEGGPPRTRASSRTSGCAPWGLPRTSKSVGKTAR